MDTLNTGQRHAVEQLTDLQKEGFTVLGEGGVGKTYTIMVAAKEWLKQGKRIAMTAPTNKAVKQLQKASVGAGIPTGAVTFATIHKMLGLALLPDAATKYTKQVGDCKFPDYDIIVIDEGSMVSSRAFYEYILHEAEDAKVKIVVMGDKMQLPPPRETESVALKHYDFVELTQVERFKSDGGIAKLTSDLRSVIEKNGTFKFSASSYDLEVVKPAQFVRKVVSMFDADTNLEQIRCLAWTNSRVDTINNAVREKIYGRNAERYEIGERVVTGKPIYDGMEMLLSTDEECIVRQVTLSSIMCPDSGKEYNTYMLSLEPIYDSNVKTVHCHVLHESSFLEFEEDLGVLYKKAETGNQRTLWAKYNALKDLFSDIKYCYCITVHRSQGSTYQTVLVDVDNILRNNRKQERNQLLYVAFSRPSETLITCKENFVS